MKRPINNTIGMFDAAKGLFVIAMLIGHGMMDYTRFWDEDISRTGFALVGVMLHRLFSYASIPVFCLICGYGYRKKSMLKCIKGQVRYVWKPYILVALAVSGCAILKKIMIQGSVLEGIRYQCLPYLLCVSPGGDYFGITMDSIGPMWFVVVFVFSGALLNLVLQEERIWGQLLIVLSMAIAGVLLSNVLLPFCIQQSLICTLYMYVGWLMKKKKFLQQEIPWYLLLLGIGIVLILATVGDLAMAGHTFKNGMTDVLGGIPGGVLILLLSLQLNRFSGWGIRVFRWFGRNVMSICCIHTVIFMVIPWERIVAYFSKHPMFGSLVTIVFYIASSVLGCLIVEHIKKRARLRKMGKQYDYQYI